MGWEWLKGLGLAFLAALTTLLGVLGGFVYTFGVELAEEANTSAVFVWTLKGVAGIAIFASLATASAAVAVSVPSKLRQSKSYPFAVAILAVVVSLLAGWYVGSLVSSLTEGDEPTGSDVYARKLSAVLNEVERAQARANQHLRNAGSGVIQASVARGLARSFSHRARAIRAIRTEVDERRATAVIATRVDDLADAYFALATAASNPKGSQGALDKVRRKVNRARRQLRSAEVALRNHGYEVVTGRSSEELAYIPVSKLLRNPRL
jgi:hypothetical protein